MKANKTWNNEDWPQFMAAHANDDSVSHEGTECVIHLHRPRFVGMVYEIDEGCFRIEPTFIDNIDDDVNLTKLIGLAEEFWKSL